MSSAVVSVAPLVLHPFLRVLVGTVALFFFKAERQNKQIHHTHPPTPTPTPTHTHSTSKNTPLEVGFKWVAPLDLPLVTTGVSTLLFFKTDSESEKYTYSNYSQTYMVRVARYIYMYSIHIFVPGLLLVL